MVGPSGGGCEYNVVQVAPPCSMLFSWVVVVFLCHLPLMSSNPKWIWIKITIIPLHLTRTHNQPKDPLCFRTYRTQRLPTAAAVDNHDVGATYDTTKRYYCCCCTKQTWGSQQAVDGVILIIDYDKRAHTHEQCTPFFSTYLFAFRVPAGTQAHNTQHTLGDRFCRVFFCSCSAFASQ